MSLLKSGVSDLKIQAPTLLLIWLKELHIWMKLKNQSFHLSNGHLNKVSYANKILEEWDSILLIANFTLTPFTEEEVNLCHQQEDCFMHYNFYASLHYFNQSLVVILLHLCNVWAVFINLLLKEEVKSFNKFKLLEHHLT